MTKVMQILAVLAAGMAVGTAIFAAGLSLPPTIGLSQRVLGKSRRRLAGLRKIITKFLGKNVGRAADLELVLLLLAAELEVGATLQQALTRIAPHVPTSMVPEVREVAKRVASGDVVQGLREWALAHGDPVLQDLVTTVEIQRDTGGPLAPILRGLAAMNRSHRLLEAQARSKAAEAVMSAWILAIAPVAIAIYTGYSRPGFLDPLWAEPVGRLALVYGIASWLVGVMWIRSLLRRIDKGRS